MVVLCRIVGSSAVPAASRRSCERLVCSRFGSESRTTVFWAVFSFSPLCCGRSRTLQTSYTTDIRSRKSWRILDFTFWANYCHGFARNSEGGPEEPRTFRRAQAELRLRRISRRLHSAAQVQKFFPSRANKLRASRPAGNSGALISLLQLSVQFLITVGIITTCCGRDSGLGRLEVVSGTVSK